MLPANLPPDMSRFDRDRSQRSRLNDVLMMLETKRALVEQQVAARVGGMLPPDVAAKSSMELSDDDAGFTVSVTPTQANGITLDRSSLAQKLPDAVASAVSDYITEHATKVGMWQPQVSAALKSDRKNDTRGAKNAKPAGGSRWFAVILAVALLGGLISWSRAASRRQAR